MNNKQEQTWTKACTRFFWQREMIRSEVTAKCSTEETAFNVFMTVIKFPKAGIQWWLIDW